MNFEAFPSEALRLRLAAIGIPRERQSLRQLLALLPAEMALRPYEETGADAVAEVLVYLAQRQVLELRPAPRLDWGGRLCLAYRSRQERLELVLPFFAEGLRRNERCLWLTREAGASVEDVEIVDPADWPDMGNALQREEARALAQGYHGLRISGDAACEARVQAAIGTLRIKALCLHPERGAP